MNGENQPQQAQQTQQPQQSSSGGSSKTVWIIVVILVVLLIAGGLAYYFLSYSKSKTETTTPSPTTEQPTSTTGEGKALPSEDVIGEDLKNVSRYPDSVRTKYYEADTYTKVTYKTKDSVKEVKEYYQEKLTSVGWKLTSSEEGQLVFDKASAKLYINFYYSKTYKTTEYELKYYPEW